MRLAHAYLHLIVVILLHTWASIAKALAVIMIYLGHDSRGLLLGVHEDMLAGGLPFPEPDKSLSAAVHDKLWSLLARTAGSSDPAHDHACAQLLLLQQTKLMDNIIIQSLPRCLNKRAQRKLTALRKKLSDVAFAET